MNNKPWSDKIRKIEPYVPGEQPQIKDIIKLNTNENPYPPSPRVKKIIEEMDIDKLRLYPSFKFDSLKEVLCGIYGVGKEEMYIGNGSDEVLALCFAAFFNSDKPILMADITYSFYDVWSEFFNVKYEKIPLNDKFEINKEDYYKENGGVIIANPNAPTSIYMGLDDIEDIVKHNESSIVIVDEAYIDFGGKSAVGLTKKYDNLVVVQTFSKSRSLAGIRIGYAMANKELIDVLEAVKNSFNSYTVSAFSQAAAAECAADIEYFDECRKKIMKTREWTITELDKLGFKTLPSMTNFIFTKNDNIEAKKLFEYLRSKKIIVRYFDKERINEYLRITIGTDEEMGKLIEAIKEYQGE